MVVSAALGSVLSAWLHRLDCADAFAQHCKCSEMVGNCKLAWACTTEDLLARLVCLVVDFFYVDTLLVHAPVTSKKPSVLWVDGKLDESAFQPIKCVK